MLDGMVCFSHYLALLHCMLIISHLSFRTSEAQRDQWQKTRMGRPTVVFVVSRPGIETSGRSQKQDQSFNVI